METFTAPEAMSRNLRRNGVTICAFFGLGWFIGGAGLLGGVAYWIGLALAVAVSVGLVGRQDGESLVSMLKRADEAMYRAKASGRDRMVLG